MAAEEASKTPIDLPRGGLTAASPTAHARAGSTARVRTPDAPNARLVCEDVSLLENGTTEVTIALFRSEVTVGRTNANTIRIPSRQLSPLHARIYPGEGKWGIEDLDSEHGTWVNGVRIDACWLTPGDVVKLGPIPFRYQLERPEVGATAAADDITENVFEQTWIFGADARAACAFLRAAERAGDDQPPLLEAALPKAAPEVQRGPTPATATVETGPPERPRDSMLKLAWTLVVLLAVLGGGYRGYQYMAEADKRQLIAHSVQRVRRFVTEIEQVRMDFSVETTRGQLGTLLEVAAFVNDAVARYPDSPRLREQQVQLLFLTYERKLAARLHRGAVDSARAVYRHTREQMARIEAALPAHDVRYAATLGEVDGLLDLSSAVIEIRAFRLDYPNPDRAARHLPSPQLLARMATERRRFATGKRRNNLALSVRYRYFQNIVRAVDETDLRLLDRWKRII